MMERQVKIYVSSGEVWAVDTEYGKDIMKVLSEDDKGRAAEIASKNSPTESCDEYLCGKMRVKVDSDTFYRHVIIEVVKSKEEAVAELGKVIVELEKKTVSEASDDELRAETRKRGI